jgi:hypothetical protein
LEGGKEIDRDLPAVSKYRIYPTEITTTKDIISAGASALALSTHVIILYSFEKSE